MDVRFVYCHGLPGGPAELAAISGGLRACLTARQPAYRAELLAYVRPWADVVRAVRCAAEIWQGDADDWTPPAMADALAAQLGDRAVLHACPGLGHYATLQAALREIA